MTEHARLMPPSSAARRIACPGSYVLESELPDKSSKASDDGTAMHAAAAMCLTQGTDAVAYIGRYIDVGDEKIEFDEDMAELVQPYVDSIRALADGHELLIEQRVDFSYFVETPDQFGTADAVIIRTDGELQVHDFKSGYHRVDVVRNPQLLLYALGAYAAHSLIHDITSVRLFIHQPKIHNEPSEWACTVHELMAFAEEARRATKLCVAAEHAHKGVASDGFAATYLRPGDEQCRFCKAAGTCPALAGKVQEVIGADFETIVEFQALPHPDLSEEDPVGGGPLYNGAALATCMQAAPLVETWLKAVRAETERRLLAGQEVPGFKLVQGKKGARKWDDPEAAEVALKTFRLKVEEMYQLKLISPTQAEKLTKPAEDGKPLIGPRQWPKLSALITQNDGKPSVAPADDKRPALVIAPAIDDFEPVTETPALEALV